MIRAILFDLDGVLIESTRQLHFLALNEALKKISSEFVISPEDHIKIYDGLSTKRKLEILNNTKKLPQSLNILIEDDKQKITWKMLENLDYSSSPVSIIKNLKESGFKLGLCTNSIKKTTNIILYHLKYSHLLDVILTNEDVEFPKPSPEIYKKAMTILDILPEESIILEDAPSGLKAAFSSGANVLKIKNIKEVNLCRINRFIQSINKLELCLQKHTEFKTLILKKSISQFNGHFQSEVLCPRCNKIRLVNNHNIIAQINKKVFTGKCITCNPSVFQNGSKHKFYNSNKLSTHGYRILNISELNDSDKALSYPMSWKSKNKPEYVFEHRLVMAKKLNRPLFYYEIVHHKNGKKDDNNINNLLLMTTKNHHPGHGDDFYQLWQEAETKIQELKQKYES